MRCTEFLAHYSDYRDGRASDPEMLRALVRHVQRCPRCMRYDAQVARGVLLLRAASDLRPSTHFGRRLRRRIAQDAVAGAPGRTGRPSVMATLTFAAAVVLVIWQTSGDRGRAASPDPVAAPITASSLPALVTPLTPLPSFVVPAFSDVWRAPGVTEVTLGGWPEVAP